MHFKIYEIMQGILYIENNLHAFNFLWKTYVWFDFEINIILWQGLVQYFTRILRILENVLLFILPSNRFVSKPNYAWETLHCIDQDMYIRINQDVPFFFFLITDHNSYPSNEGFGSHHDTADQCGWRHQPRFQSWRPDDYSWSHRYARLNWRMRSSGSKWWEV